MYLPVNLCFNGVGFITFLVLDLLEGFLVFFPLLPVALRAQNPLRKQIDTPLTLTFGSVCSGALMGILAKICELYQYISALKSLKKVMALPFAISQVTSELLDVG